MLVELALCFPSPQTDPFSCDVDFDIGLDNSGYQVNSFLISPCVCHKGIFCLEGK